MTVFANGEGSGSRTGSTWLIALRRYISFVAVANLVWEFMHLPLYTLWTEGSVGDLVFAAVHCTG